MLATYVERGLVKLQNKTPSSETIGLLNIAANHSQIGIFISRISFPIVIMMSTICNSIPNLSVLLMTLTLLLFTLCDLVTGYRLPLNVEIEVPRIDKDEFMRALHEALYRYENSIDGFARLDVCGTPSGKEQFIADMKTKLCDVNEFFVFEFVENLCEECDSCEGQNNNLSSWIRLLYDFDGNGYIDNDERIRFSRRADYRSRG